ncbi:MAG TPA: sigma 54-interacting transcriptional regulator [Kofleriaceae bacterium]|jgi:transcriptional regulator with GAF, ATPase, and Fis domain|nr:sigma 54-interacting transcriptional regulator [Kofleriaceae bacterium]
MSLARLVVIEGPDAGREFELPMRGGVVGRGDGSLVQLTDPAVSRQHGLIELRDGVLCWVDDSGKQRTLINGRPPVVHALGAGDEIVLGATKLVYLPVDGVAVTRASSHVTMEVGSRQLLALTGDLGDHRARRHLAALAQLGDRLRAESAAGRDAVARAAGDAALTALGAHRAFVLSVSATARRVTPIAATVTAGEATQLQAPGDLVDKVINGKQVVTAETGGRALIAAPVHGVADDVIGVLWIDRKGAPWDQIDTLAVGCLAHLTGAAWVGAEARDQLVRRADALEEQLNGPLSEADFVGKSAAAQRVIAFVTRVAPSDATVLLGGESGSGKEMVARAIHRASRRAKGPCVAVNCAALTESLIESELFGHEKGAFTGATEKKAGRFEMADHGTLFLDEVGELPLGLQTKFLRVLEERRFERVGGQKAIEVDVRMVAATNRDLAEMVKRGTFREDLFYRLSVIHIEVPPLRERLDDVPLLAEFFLARFRSQAARRISGFAPDAIAAMTRYAWPGNVRELRNAVERAIVLGDREQIIADDLPPQVLAMAAAPRTRPAHPTPPLGSNSIAPPALAAAPPASTSAPAPIAPASPLAPASTPVVTIDPLPPPQLAAAKPPPPAARSLRDLEKQGILAALAATGGNKAQAAAILEIDRSTLYKKLKDYDIES